MPFKVSFGLSLGDIIRELLRCLQRIPFPVNLESLSRVEQELVEHFGVPQFGFLEQGFFLQFITRQPRVFKALGGQQLGSTTSDSPLRQRLLSFIQQLKEDDKVFVHSNCSLLPI